MNTTLSSVTVGNEAGLPSMIDWELMDSLDRTVWAASFATNFSLRGVAQATADCVRALRLVSPQRNLPDDAATRATLSGVDLSKEEFFIWYSVEHRISHGRSNPMHILSSVDIDEAFERYPRSRTDFY
jgi:hypothetical protein